MIQKSETRWGVSLLLMPKIYLHHVVLLSMMENLLKIRNEMGLPQGQSRPLHADREPEFDEVGEDQNEWIGVSAKCNPYHTGYTTNHWLIVFRAVEATA